ncbi:hypothetical protein DRF65_14210 [Chryseobacterium pennae]|uniref:Uncharacterized protein n=1 Tax=Chryseobacterium pennae TaxID=2258962 RepID=A0A3D9C7D0_9FLAO|nr:hypothetical protein [Chryseobacterium pennae]REC61608.1 hypothetical protein DRF65_14210 [Chryseobacterium pennae]
MKPSKKAFIETKYLFYSKLAIIPIVIISVWLSGKGGHRSLFQNSIVSTSILAGVFFLFITLGLYYGLKLKDNVGSILNSERIKKYTDKTPSIDGFDFDPPAVGDGIGGAILSVVVWIIFSIVLIFLSYFLGLFFWSALLFLTAMLYWIFFRALRLVFKNSGKCKGNMIKSLGFGAFYSFLYVSWIYGIIFLVNYIN